MTSKMQCDFQWYRTGTHPLRNLFTFYTPPTVLPKWPVHEVIEQTIQYHWILDSSPYSKYMYYTGMHECTIKAPIIATNFENRYAVHFHP